MHHNYQNYTQQPPLPVYPPPDFSVPPPIPPQFINNKKDEKVNNEKFSISTRDYGKPREYSSTNVYRCERSFLPSRNYERNTSRHIDRVSEYSSEWRRSRSRDRERRRSRSRERSRYSRERRRSRTRSRERSRSNRESSRRKSPERYSRPPSRRSSPPQKAKSSKSETKSQTEREKLLEKWRNNYCETSEQITKKLMELANEEEQTSWIRSSPADIYYRRVNANDVEATPRLDALCTLFEKELLERSVNIKASQAPYKPPDRRRKMRVCRHKSE